MTDSWLIIILRKKTTCLTCWRESLVSRGIGRKVSKFKLTPIYEDLPATPAPDGDTPPPSETEADKLVKFWRDVVPLMRTAPDGTKLHDVARLDYTVEQQKVPENMDDPEKKVIELKHSEIKYS